MENTPVVSLKLTEMTLCELYETLASIPARELMASFVYVSGEVYSGISAIKFCQRKINSGKSIVIKCAIFRLEV